MSNIPVQLAIDIARIGLALSQAHIVKHNITSNIDDEHHLATLTIQVPQICCPVR